MSRNAFASPAPLAVAALAGATAALGVWRWLQFTASMRAGDELADHAVAFARDGKAHAPKVLVVGDSTGVGTGAARPEESIAGLLGASYPDVAIDFFHPGETEHFCRRSRYFACDGLHPSSALYRYIYETMIAATPIAALLARPRLAAVPALPPPPEAQVA
ncbi:MAG: hypothetical protein IT518_12820 [Burkholderiales bacterium]|nr:hypothetical protein [Burkholderiales bacterium]